MIVYGARVAKQGYSQTDGDQYQVYNSPYPLLKIKAHGTGSVTTNGTGGVGSTVIYAHNLNYKPMFAFLSWYDDGSTLFQKFRSCPWQNYLGGGITTSFYATADLTNLLFSIDFALANRTYQYKWWLYYDSIS